MSGRIFTKFPKQHSATPTRRANDPLSKCGPRVGEPAKPHYTTQPDYNPGVGQAGGGAAFDFTTIPIFPPNRAGIQARPRTGSSHQYFIEPVHPQWVPTQQVQRQADVTQQAEKTEEEEEKTLQASRALIQRQAEEEEEEIVQAKFTVGEPNDKYEQQADRMADTVMRMPEPVLPRQGETEKKEETEEEQLQTKPLADAISPLIQRQAEQEEETVQTKTRENNAPTVSTNMEGQLRHMQGSGQPLLESTRQFFEPRFGQDFSNVRIHADGQAANAAKTIQAQAFTHKKDIYFGEGHYQPDTVKGKTLLAHELTHTIQQGENLRPALQLKEDKQYKIYIFKKGDKNLYQLSKKLGVDFGELKELNKHLAPNYIVGPGSEIRVPLNAKTGEKVKTKQTKKGKQYKIYIFQEGDKNLYQLSKKLGVDFGDLKELNKHLATKYIVGPGSEIRLPLNAKTGEGAGEKSTEAGDKVCLTFDDGPGSGTQEVLDVIGNTIPATFFLIGKNINKKTLALVKTMIKRKNVQIGNHTFDHYPARIADYKKQFGNLSTAGQQQKFIKWFKQVSKRLDELGIKHELKLVRLPGGGTIYGRTKEYKELHNKMIKLLEAKKPGLGLAHVGWDGEFATNKFFGKRKGVERDWQGIKGVGKDGRTKGIILFHDRHWAGGFKGKLGQVIKVLGKTKSFGNITKGGGCG